MKIISSHIYSYTFNPLEHLAGVAPYFEPLDPPTDPSTPQGCSPVRAAYLVRHAAIYANDYDYEEYLSPFVEKFQNLTSSIDWTSTAPALSFLSSWTPPVTTAEEELLTRVGKLEAAQLGVSLSFRYGDKLALPPRIWASSAERTYESAKALIRGFEPAGGDNSIGLVSVYESDEGGADTLTPYSSCPLYDGSAGSDQSGVYLDKFTGPVRARLNAAAPSFNFTADDIYGMMEMCGYETVIRGSSPFCNLELFGPDDWLGWEYTADLQYHYNVGYGSPVAGAVGMPWVRATADLLMAEDAQQDLYVSFTHRELPPMVLVAMGLFNNSAFSGSSGPANVNDTMPEDTINHRRAWRSSHVLPFMTNIAVERLNCSGSYGFDDGDYYRALVNNAPQQLPDCGDGPGTTCSRATFEQFLQQRADMFGNYSEVCDTASEYDNSTDVLTIYTDPAVGNGTFVGKRGMWDGE
ncbi:phosphoglycerate mutase-like protein [Cryphonectria parasitica EP155]|uniref:Phosphoglycerate mutase-like protein n=1 Tax=Cryphonectria parasitica (strain ATCC 38755 / EP155) TaxID=660469 RepID=A0A9P4XZH6_CRYP1|nr:phosphoglycerate mutase-like protein [Cryphonectria parasitica EP155]KAF3763380.1 phosphoglycerate mutase-like protein [Cryphonectria parasitica EP155]